MEYTPFESRLNRRWTWMLTHYLVPMTYAVSILSYIALMNQFIAYAATIFLSLVCSMFILYRKPRVRKASHLDMVTFLLLFQSISVQTLRVIAGYADNLHALRSVVTPLLLLFFYYLVPRILGDNGLRDLMIFQAVVGALSSIITWHAVISSGYTGSLWSMQVGCHTVVDPVIDLNYLAWIQLVGFVSSLHRFDRLGWRLACAGLCFSGMLLASARAALGSALIFVVVFLVIWGMKRNSRTLLLTSLVGISIGVLLFWMHGGSSIMGPNHPGLSGRVELWTDSLSRAAESPLLGVPTSNLPARSSHNTVFDYAVANGVLGAIIYLAVFAVAFLSAFRSSSNDSPWLMAALAAYTASSMFTTATFGGASYASVTIATCLGMISRNARSKSFQRRSALAEDEGAAAR